VDPASRFFLSGCHRDQATAALAVSTERSRSEEAEESHASGASALP